MMEKELSNTREPIKARAVIYKAVFYMVLLYANESWVVMDLLIKVL